MLYYNRRNFLKSAGLGTALLSMPNVLKSARHSPSPRPNILFIMSDDHCAQGIGAYGGRLAKLNPTPNIDKLASEGMLLENCFCNNSICVPSRASILTGQYSQTNGALDLNDKLLRERHYLSKLMQKAGYNTAMLGKWHLKVEPNGFDYYKVLPGQGKYFDPEFHEMGKGKWPKNKVKHKGHSSDVITDIALDWFKNKRQADKPFFLMLHFKAPHDMFQNAKRYDSYLEDVEIPEPDSLYDRGEGSVATRGENNSLVHKIGTSVSKRHHERNMGKHMNVDQSLPDKQYTHVAYQRYLKRYLRCVKGVDDNLGRLFEYLKKNDLMDNTVIMYTDDQGFMLGEHDYIDKRWMYEESMRMPFIIRYPKTVKPDSRTDALINNTDFAPTMLDFAGVDVPDYMQGRSFKSVVETGKEPDDWRDATYYRYWMHMAHHWNPAHFGIRTKRYKLIFFYGRTPDGKNQTPPGWEMYDLKKDPHEMDNVYNEPQYAEVQKRLKAKLKSVREKLNETDEDYPAIQKIIEKHWDD